MNWVNLIIQLVSGAVGGNISGSLFKNINLGTLGNSIAGIVGGILVGQVLPALGIGNASATDVTSILTSILGGGVGGGALMAIIGAVTKSIGKKS